MDVCVCDGGGPGEGRGVYWEFLVIIHTESTIPFVM